MWLANVYWIHLDQHRVVLRRDLLNTDMNPWFHKRRVISLLDTTTKLLEVGSDLWSW